VSQIPQGDGTGSLNQGLGRGGEVRDKAGEEASGQGLAGIAFARTVGKNFYFQSSSSFKWKSYLFPMKKKTSKRYSERNILIIKRKSSGGFSSI
jgi:hypothetical protein